MVIATFGRVARLAADTQPGLDLGGVAQGPSTMQLRNDLLPVLVQEVAGFGWNVALRGWRLNHEAVIVGQGQRHAVPR
jgi:hypothetical protein